MSVHQQAIGQDSNQSLNPELLTTQQNTAAAAVLGVSLKGAVFEALESVKQLSPKQAPRDLIQDATFHAASRGIADQAENSPLAQAIRGVLGKPTSKTIVAGKLHDVRSDRKTGGHRASRNNLSRTRHTVPNTATVPPHFSTLIDSDSATSASAPKKPRNHYRYHPEVFDDDSGEQFGGWYLSKAEQQAQREAMKAFESHVSPVVHDLCSPTVPNGSPCLFQDHNPDSGAFESPKKESPSKKIADKAMCRLFNAAMGNEALEGVSEEEANAAIQWNLRSSPEVRKLVRLGIKSRPTYGSPEAAKDVAKYALRNKK